MYWFSCCSLPKFSFSSFIDSLWFSTYIILFLIVRKTILLFLLLYPFSCLVHWSESSVLWWEELMPVNMQGKIHYFSIKCDTGCKFFLNALYQIKEISFPNLFRVLSINLSLILSNSFSISTETDHMSFS